jgi:hypothetical protein
MSNADKIILKRIKTSPKRVYIAHYACENLIAKTVGHSARVASISLINYSDGMTQTYSLPIEAERLNLKFEEIPDNLELLEKNLLKSFFAFTNDHPESIYIHWNMSDSVYGFPAIYHRYQVLFGTMPQKIANESQLDLAALMKAQFGLDYIAYPRLQNLLEYNKFSSPSLLSGEEEAALLSRGEYVTVSRSNIAKAKGISYLFGLYVADKIQVPNKPGFFQKIFKSKKK